MKDSVILVPPQIMSAMTEIWDAKQIDPGQYQAVLAEAERREDSDTVQWLRNNYREPRSDLRQITSNLFWRRAINSVFTSKQRR
ncbi:hypothetical protein AXX12_07375 [Anaerosporomusa subterranea]|uniref:Uncharacterized protein n=1 Tax=Anaerosporomusa subterranea TaxID=1794912 RepID=A0A154BQM6_ANASB|nr:hypothetical protein [Anaerosporomusa subterranea]KYZ76252.1 hypothetical protein AXX12_07375 [Anaerosporomusa subterranea]